MFAKAAEERLGGWVVKFKGIKISFNAFDENGKRVKEISVGGKALAPDKAYNICPCKRDGNPANMLCRIEDVTNAKNTPHTLHTILKGYLAIHSPVTPVPPMKAKVLDAPQTLLTQVTGVNYQFH